MRMMILVFLVSVILPTLCLCSCCLPLAPPEFMLSAPPRPPGLNLELPCAVGGDMLWTNYNSDKNKNLHSGSNWTGIHHPGDQLVPNTSAFPTLADKKSLSVVAVSLKKKGVLFLILVIPLVYILTRCKQVKYQVDPDPNEEHQNKILQIGHNKMHAWFWRNNNESSKKLRNLFKGIQKSDGSISSTSSESGYCEDVLENQDHTMERSGNSVVMRKKRSPRQRPSSSRPVVMTEATPDIIASTQKDLLDDGTPKRWSMFGLLPSLKPLLNPRPNPLDGMHTACSDDTDQALPDTILLKAERPTIEDTVAGEDKNADDIPMKELTSLWPGDKQRAQTYGGMPQPNRPHQQHSPRGSQTTVDHSPAESTRCKTSKVRICNDSNHPEIEV